MELREMMKYISDLVYVYHEPRNEMVDSDLLLGIYDFDDVEDYDRCLKTLGKFNVVESGVSEENGHIRILLGKK